METKKQCPDCGHDLRHVTGWHYRCTNCTYAVYKCASNSTAQRVITVRLPASIHQALKDEAKRLSLKLGEDVSMNRLCVEKLKEPL